MSEKKGEDKEEKQKEEKAATKKTQLALKKSNERYWSFIRVLDEINYYLENNLYPMLRRQGVGDNTIAMLSARMAVAIQEVLVSQLAIMKPTTESIRSLEEVQDAVEKIYKQYSENQISPKDALDMLFSVFDTLRKKK